MNLKKRKIPTNIGISFELLEKIDKLTQEEGISRSELVCKLIELGLEKYKSKKQT